jgi:hypothetical protein
VAVFAGPSSNLQNPSNPACGPALQLIAISEVTCADERATFQTLTWSILPLNTHPAKSFIPTKKPPDGVLGTAVLLGISELAEPFT